MVSIALLTVSDTRNIKNDDSGNYLLLEAENYGHKILERKICKDDIYLIRKYLSDWISNPDVEVIITTGGTGITARDVTPEAVRPLLEKEIDGFGETFRFLSFQKIGTSTLQSRCIAGTANGKFIFVLPGSKDAVMTGWQDIISHQLNENTKPCNLVNLINRLKE